MEHDSELLPPRAAPRDDAPAVSTRARRGRVGVLLDGIQTRLQLSHLLMSLLPVLALGSLLIYSSIRSEQRTTEQVQESVARSIASDLSGLLNGLADDLDDFGKRAGQPDALETLPDAADALLARHAGLILELDVLDAAGAEVLRRSQEAPDEQLRLRQRVAELVARVALDGDRHWGVVRPSRGHPSIQIGVPIMAGPEGVNGAVVAEVDTQLLAKRLASIPPSTGRSAFVVDQTGALLVGQPSRKFEREQLERAWEADATLASLPAAGGDIVLARAPLGEGWFVVVEQPEAEVATDQSSTTLMTVLLVCTGLLVAAWAVVLAREISGPLLRLREAARSAGAGGMVAGVPVERPDEVGDLALEFNRMLELLSASRAENEQRSRELSAARHELELRNAELRESLQLVRVVQHDLLAHALPPDAPIEVAASSEPTGQDGYDFFVCVSLPDRRARVILGDAAVSGRPEAPSGMAAALVMALTASLLEVHARDATGPAELLEQLNSILFPHFAQHGTSVGLLVAEFDQASARLSVANAGMIAPLVVEQDGQEYVECFGPPLGVVEAARYEAVSVPLMEGQTAVFVSDGIIEARDANNEMWSFARLEQTVAAAVDCSPQTLVEQVRGAIRRYAAPDSSSDSRTIVAVRLKPAGGAEN